MGDVLGLHLLPHLGLVSSPRRSVLARLGPDGGLQALDEVDTDAAIASMLDSQTASVLVVDAPIEVPNADGRRDVESVLAWCDITAFPVSTRRLTTVFGGARGVGMASTLADGGRRAIEALPDQVLRQIAWEREHPIGAPPLALADYRAAWLGVHPPRHRPKGVGRARPEGIVAAWNLLAEVIDMADWAPAVSPDDWTAINDSARIDALCCAYAGMRLRDPDAGMSIGAPGHGEVALAVDANLRRRLAATLERLRAEGTVHI